MKTKLEIIQEILSEHQAQKVKCGGRKVLIDAFTASAIMAVYNAISEQNKIKFMNLSWTKISQFACKTINKAKI